MKEIKKSHCKNRKIKGLKKIESKIKYDIQIQSSPPVLIKRADRKENLFDDNEIENLFGWILATVIVLIVIGIILGIGWFFLC